MRKKVLGWILIIYSIAVFLMVLTYLILNPMLKGKKSTMKAIGSQNGATMGFSIK